MAENNYVIVLYSVFRASKHMRKLPAYVESQSYDILNLESVWSLIALGLVRYTVFFSVITKAFT